MKIFLKSFVRFYRGVFSPWLGTQCRFQPTCSLYALEALDHYSAGKACLLIGQRLLKCHPFHPGGWDPLSGKESIK